MFKPFKPPLSRPPLEKARTIDLTIELDSESDTGLEPTRPYKKRKLLVHDVIPDSPPKKVFASSGVNAPRKPLLVKQNNELKLTKVEEIGPEGYYRVLWLVIALLS